MRTLILALIALGLGAWLGFALNEEPPAPQDPISIIVTQLKTQAIVEHERQIAVWYKSCPDVTGVDPLMFVAWPGKLSFELPLGDVAVERQGETLRVRTAAVRVDEPAVPTDAMDYVSTEPLLNLVDEMELVNREMRKASGIARYLATYYLKRDPTLYDDLTREVQQLVLRIAGAVDAGITRVEVDIPRPDPVLPKLPTLELCEGARAAVNGLPFAKTEEGHLIPIAFRVRAEGEKTPDSTPQGTTVVYGVEKEDARKPAR